MTELPSGRFGPTGTGDVLPQPSHPPHAPPAVGMGLPRHAASRRLKVEGISDHTA
jgi:hypothetical protein